MNNKNMTINESNDANRRKYADFKNTYRIALAVVTVICIISGSIYHLTGFFDFADRPSSTNRPENTAENTAEYAVGEVEGIKSIDLNIDDSYVVIKYGEFFGLDIDDFARGSEPEARYENGELVISQRNKRSFAEKVFHWGNRHDNELIITIPYGAAPQLTGEISKGFLEAKGVEFADIDMEVDMGAIELDNCKFNKGEMEADMGEVHLENVSFDSATLTSDMGEVYVKGEFNTLFADCDMGAVEVYFEGDADGKRIELTADLGSVTVNGMDCGTNYFVHSW